MKELLQVQDLQVKFRTSKGLLHAVRKISFSMYPGEIVGIVGESGCGKSAAIKALSQIHHRSSCEIGGKILYNDQDLLTFSEDQMRKVRGKEISMIFQDPMTSLNPTMPIGKQIMEGYLQHFPEAGKVAAKEKALQMLLKVGIPFPLERFYDYPHMLSGGMRQRVMIAIALACEPKLLLADEPTTALDVTIQAQILELLKSIQKEMQTAILLITHDLGVVANFCSRILVMYAGKIIEQAPVEELFCNPQHPYTKLLIAAIPRMDQNKEQKLLSIAGTPPNLLRELQGCSFCPRCPYAMKICMDQDPPLFMPAREHTSACFLHDKRRLG